MRKHKVGTVSVVSKLGGQKE